MRATSGIFFIICLLFLVGTVGAAGIPDTITVITDNSTIVANNVDHSLITINVTNTSSNPADAGPVPNVQVSLTVDPSYGTLSSSSVTTNPSGIATVTFTAKKLSGAPQIIATIADPALSASVIQNIEPRVLSATFSPDGVTVNDATDFTVSIRDQSGVPINPVDGDTSVLLSVSCPMPNDCEFVGFGHLYPATPDVFGNLTAPLKIGTRSGTTTIVMSPVQDLPQQIFMIETSPGPLSLSVQVNPATLTVPAGREYFEFVYTLADSFGNPAANQAIQINTSENESLLTVTNYFGQTPVLKYGPKANISIISVNATVVSMPDITNVVFVSFTAPVPHDLRLTVSPKNMSSLDKDPNAFSWATVLVHDEYGEPVSGQTISFSLAYTPGAEWNVNPHLETEQGITDANGMASVRFIPGSFSTTGPFTGSAQVKAIWDAFPDINKTEPVYWTNRPYINLLPNATPNTVQMGDYIDVVVNVSVYGDYPPAPATIMLNQDTSASMGNTRLGEATAAMTTFIYKMNPAYTQIGLETVGHDKPSSKPPYAYPYTEPTSDFPALEADLAELVKGDSTLVMDAMIYRSINELNAHTTGSHTGDLKVLILLSDGGTNLCNQNGLDALNQTAIDSNVYVFPICYNNNCNQGQSPVQMNALAEATGGKFYTAKDTVELDQVFQAIYEKIMELAGAGTQMTLSFDDINIQEQPFAGTEVYDYMPVNIPAGLPASQVSPASSSVDTAARTSIIWPNGTQSIVDQSLEWQTNSLNFHVGAVPLGKTWSTTFRLKPKILGCYNVFGDDSVIVLNGVPTPLPATGICVNAAPQNTDFNPGTLDVSNLQATGGTWVTIPNLGPTYAFSDFASIQWVTTYNSTTSTNTATETASYRSNGVWKQFDVRTLGTMLPSDSETLQTTLDVRNLPSGMYQIRVYGEASDAAPDQEQSYITVYRSSDKRFLNLS